MTDENKERKERFQQQLFDLITEAVDDGLCLGCLAAGLIQTSVDVCRLAALTPVELDRHGFKTEASDPTSVVITPPWATPRH